MPDTTFTDGPASPTNDNTPTFAFTSTKTGSTFECKLDDGQFAACTSPLTLQALADGPHTLAVRATDSRRQRRQLAGRARVHGRHRRAADDDRQRPAVFTFSASETGAKFECKLDGAAFAPCTSPQPIGDLADGEHTFSVRATDLAGNTDDTPATRTFTVDKTPPVTTITRAPAANSNDTMPVIEFGSEPGATFECRLAGLANPGTFTPCTSPRSYGPLTDDSYTFSVRATDAAGNVGQPVSASFTIATRGPQTGIANGPDPLSNDPSPVFELTSSLPGATFECKVDARPWAPCSSTFLTGQLADGEHTFSARASDGLGNVDETPATRTFTIDTTPPDSTVDSGPTAPVHTGPLAFGVRATDGKLECALDDGDYGSCGIVLRADDLAVGDHVFRARATDRVGNVGQPAEWIFTVVNEAPVAKLDLDADTGPAPHTLHATITGTDAENDRLTYELDFGDGQNATGTLPAAAIAHRYETAGTYTVRLTVGDGRDSGFVERTITVDVPQVFPAPPPPARALAQPQRTRRSPSARSSRAWRATTRARSPRPSATPPPACASPTRAGTPPATSSARWARSRSRSRSAPPAARSHRSPAR